MANAGWDFAVVLLAGVGYGLESRIVSPRGRFVDQVAVSDFRCPLYRRPWLSLPGQLWPLPESVTSKMRSWVWLKQWQNHWLLVRRHFRASLA